MHQTLAPALYRQQCNSLWVHPTPVSASLNNMQVIHTSSAASTAAFPAAAAAAVVCIPLFAAAQLLFCYSQLSTTYYILLTGKYTRLQLVKYCSDWQISTISLLCVHKHTP